MTRNDLTPVRRAARATSFIAAAAIALSVAFGTSGTAFAANSGEDNITVNGSILSTITLTLPQNAIAFGNLTPNNSTTPVSGVTGLENPTVGTLYTYTTGGDVSVQSNAAWTGTVQATLTAPSLTVSDLGLVGTGGSAFGASPLSFGSGATGVSTYHHDYSVQVDWTDTTGDFSATITYEVGNS